MIGYAELLLLVMVSDQFEPHESSLLGWHVESHRLFFTNVVSFIAVLMKQKIGMAFVDLLTQWFLRLKKKPV